MKYTLYIKFQNETVTENANLTLSQIKALLNVVAAKQIKVQYALRIESNVRPLVNTKRVSNEQLRSDKLIFKVI